MGFEEKGKTAEKRFPQKTVRLIKGLFLILVVLCFGAVFWILGMFLELIDYLYTKLGRPYSTSASGDLLL